MLAVCVCERERERERARWLMSTHIRNIDCVCETLQASLILEMCTPPYGLKKILDSSEILVFLCILYLTIRYILLYLLPLNTHSHVAPVNCLFQFLILFFCGNLHTGHTLVESMLIPHLWNEITLNQRGIAVGLTSAPSGVQLGWKGRGGNKGKKYRSYPACWLSHLNSLSLALHLSAWLPNCCEAT